MNNIVQIQWTAPSMEEARAIATELVSLRLVACANLVPSIKSIYLWKGSLETTREVKVFFKTPKRLFSQVEAFIKEKCSYEVPEISYISFEGGNVTYFEWVLASSRN